MKLGIVYKDGNVINHRSLLKVLINPILRYFGLCIGTVFEDNKLKGIKIFKQKRMPLKWEKYDVDYDYIVKKRLLI